MKMLHNTMFTIIQRAWPERSTLVIHCRACQVFLACFIDRVNWIPTTWTVIQNK